MRRFQLGAIAVMLATASLAEAQIIQPALRTRPVAWSSLSVGWFQQGDICGADTGTCWRFGGAPQFRGTLELPMGGGAAIGLAATTARVPLVYERSLSLPGGCGQCDADGNVTQLLATLRLGGGSVGFHQVIDFSAGSTLYHNFRATDGRRLGAGNTVNDISFGLGYGFGYSISNRLQVVLVQEWMLALHQRQPGSSENTSSQQNIRIGGRVALGERQ